MSTFFDFHVKINIFQMSKLAPPLLEILAISPGCQSVIGIRDLLLKHLAFTLSS